MLHHAATQTQTMEGGERCTFSSWKYSHYFEFVSAQDENIKERCTLCAGYKVLSSFKKIWSGSTAQLSLQIKSHQVALSRELRAKPWPRLLQEVPHHPNNKARLWCKTSKWGELKKLVRWYVAEESLHLNTVDSPRFVAQ